MWQVPLKICTYTNCGVMSAIPDINQSEEITKQKMCSDWLMCGINMSPTICISTNLKWNLVCINTNSSHWLTLDRWQLHCNLDHDWLIIDYKLCVSLWLTVYLTLLTSDLIGYQANTHCFLFNIYILTPTGQLGACSRKESWVNRNFLGLVRLRKFWFDHCIVWYKPSSALDFTRP